MMKRHARLLFAATFSTVVFALAKPVTASPIMYSLSGTISDASGIVEGEIAVGDFWTGTFGYDTDAFDASGWHWEQTAFGSLTVNGFTWSYAPPLNTQLINLGGTLDVEGGGLSCSSSQFCYGDIFLYLGGVTWPDDGTPPDALTWSDQSWGTYGLDFLGDRGGLRANVENVSAVPEPSSLWLLAAGAAAFGACRRWQGPR